MPGRGGPEHPHLSNLKLEAEFFGTYVIHQRLNFCKTFMKKLMIKNLAQTQNISISNASLIGCSDFTEKTWWKKLAQIKREKNTVSVVAIIRVLFL